MDVVELTHTDWKVRKNIKNGISEELGKQIIHFKEAFHGRTGYTISMTNTFNLNKIKYFTKFDWPRITNPKITYPLNKENLEKVKDLEIQAVVEIEQAISKNPNDIAALIIEPIQAEGGDPNRRGRHGFDRRPDRRGGEGGLRLQALQEKDPAGLDRDHKRHR